MAGTCFEALRTAALLVYGGFVGVIIGVALCAWLNGAGRRL